jgi:hypothetical protein
MVIHFNVDGHLACGHKGEQLSASRELNRVKCRSCRNTDAAHLACHVASVTLAPWR